MIMNTMASRVAYGLYRAAGRAAEPALHLLLRWRRLRGLEHPTRWPERFGRPSSPRPLPPAPGGRPCVLWFHAVSLGEGLASIPLIKHCLRHRPDFLVLMTTTTLSAFEVIKDQLPSCVIYQLAPLDSPMAMENFLSYWKPDAVLLMESELWPNLIISAAERGNTVQAVRFQLLHASPSIIHFAGDLKYGMLHTLSYAVGDLDVSEKDARKINNLQLQMNNRPIWMAASVHKGEEEVMLWAHDELIKIFPTLLMILVTRHPQDGQKIASELKKQRVNVSLRSRSEVIFPSTSVYVVDTLGELRMLYRVTPIAVIGGSFLPGLAGHNVSEAAAMGCAVLTGPHVGHFSHMLGEMRKSNVLSVSQVAGKIELLETLKLLLGDAKALEDRQKAAKQAFSIMSNGVVGRVWNLVNTIVLEKFDGVAY
ncbi:probable 3-deoxy-D-manno-octulosonic acid transferase, mitochondrial isoform X4 [Ananas comosus]|uniref:lipid IVA 3-deoxy-D-manno-octulosonic acid transferase n=1 Tax=Ananas comosus TaxID=4615 RepID=A0A6P5G8I2_ANACO|nr:probable 3-deoxy-D-manno-octulosonic acid transferase, mitochondrial isoform X4 [Ananas comosus]